MKRHIAIFSTPGPTHVYPTLTILKTLLRRGYRVTYVTSASFSALIEGFGAEVLLCPRIEFPFTQNRNETAPIEEQHSPDIVDLGERTVALVLPFYKQNKPDMILYDSAAYGGLAVAEKLGVRTIRISPQFAYSTASLECSVIPPAQKKALLDLNRLADRFFHAHGVKGSNIIFNVAEPRVYLYVEDFQLGERVEDRSSLYAGRCAAERPCNERWKSSLVRGSPAILVSASTVYREGFEYYRTCAQAFSNLNWHIVLAIGRNDPAAFYPLPPNVEIIQSTPLILVMPHVDLIVCAAGMTTTMESMYHGLPMLMLTHGHHELESYAQNIENMGLGRHLRRDAATVADIAQCALQMLKDGAMRARVQQMKKKVRRSAGGEEVANWMESILEGARIAGQL